MSYPDGWACEVLFLVPGGARQQSTTSVVEDFRSSRNSKCVSAKALALPEAARYLTTLFPPPPAGRDSYGAKADGRPLAPPFYGEVDHLAVKTFVLEMSDALQRANTALRSRRLPVVPQPPSSAGMAAFLRRAQAEMQRQRGAASDG